MHFNERQRESKRDGDILGVFCPLMSAPPRRGHNRFCGLSRDPGLWQGPVVTPTGARKIIDKIVKTTQGLGFLNSVSVKYLSVLPDQTSFSANLVCAEL